MARCMPCQTPPQVPWSTRIGRGICTCSRCTTSLPVSLLHRRVSLTPALQKLAGQEVVKAAMRENPCAACPSPAR